ncbi:MAG: 30S ribosomal protein S9 [Candidatus Pacebacteria bacterium]|nr:30S ribosomal protein S9 [Candidatus Paceibacterota bacterium]
MTPTTTTRYIETVGRRKTASARVRITPAAKGSFMVNDKELTAFFATKELQAIAVESLTLSKMSQQFIVTALVKGGGINGQAEAIRHGLARAIIIHDKELRGKLKKAGFLKRDPRAKERRKFGLKKARKAPQWAKR